MKHISKLLLTFIFSIFATFGYAQHSTTNCPGVPGACGYTGNSTTRSGNPSTPQDGNGTLGNVYNVSKCGLNYVAVSNRIGQRFTPAGVLQPAPFTVNGLQVCDSIEKAFLWVEGSGTGAAQTATIQGPSGPAQNFPLSVVGTGPDKCWGYTGTVTYRADVTSVITGNGTYNISGLFTSTTTPGEDMDGATLVIIYSDHMATYQGTLVIDDGAIVINGGIANYNMNYAAVCGATTNAKAFCCLGDIQFAVTSIDLNGTPTGFPWNWWNYVEVNTTVNAAQTTSNYNVNTSGDCFNLCVTGLYYQTASCAVCPLNSPLLNVAAASTPSTCPGCNGTATATPNPPGIYTYSWNPSGQTSQTATNLCAGVYTVSVTGGCLTQTTTVTVGNTGNLTASTTQTNVNCYQGSNGTATVNPSGGTGPYTYSWTPSGGNAATATGLSAGTYTCTTTDANGCVYVNGFTITQPVGMTIAMSQTNILCNGQTNGTGSAAVTGGSPGYTYVWSPTGGNSATATNFGVGIYSVTITDSNGCPQTETISITEPLVLSSTMTTIDVGCAASGSATINMSGGTGPYSYLWSDGGNSATDINLTVGTYTVLVTDANGCTYSDTAIIVNTSGITNTSNYTDITCNGMNNGIATIVPSGGNAPYTYSWSPNMGNTATVSPLAPGNYSVTATDANGCVTTATFVFINPPILTTISASTNVSCNGGNDASGTVAPSGGTGPYSYTWSPTGGNAQTSNGLSAGSYTIIVTDAHGCISTQSITVTQPIVLLATTSGDSACPGQNANITSNGTGGVPPYTYSWSSGPNPNSPNQTVTISATTVFTITITDANSCTTTATTTVTMNPSPSALFTSNAINGVYTLTGVTSQLCFTGPNGLTSWFWDLNGVSTSTDQSPCVTVSSADVGSYCATLTATNSSGCTDTSEVCVEINNVYYSIPNVFTPDNDGINDAFIITNMGMKDLHCELYNRWGELIYEWDGPTGYWNGKAKSGNDAVDGVYYYTVYMTDFQDKNYAEHGFVQLIRGKK